MSSVIKYFPIDDAAYAYEISGEGIPVVLLHGFTGSRSTWSPLTSMWNEEFQLITIDLPGHGETIMQTPRTMEECCRDLMKLFQHLKLPSFHLVGYSMGGRIALLFALLYPHLIASLILESASPGIQLSEARKERIENDEKLAQRIEVEGVTAFVNFWEQLPLFATQKNMSNISRQVVRQERLGQSQEGLAGSLRQMGTGRQPSLWGRLDSVSNPVLLIVGEKDLKFVEVNEQMEKSFQIADLVIVENAGHAVHVEKPRKFGKLVEAFILRL